MIILFKVVQAGLLIKLFATTHGSRIQFFALRILLISFLKYYMTYLIEKQQKLRYL